MAKVKGVKVKAKREVVRNPLFLDEKYTGEEPTWDHERALLLSPDEFDHHMRASMNYYNYYFNQKDLRKQVVKWMQDHTKLNAKQVSTYMSTPEMQTPMTVCSLIKANSVGMPLKEKHRDYILKSIHSVIESAAAAEPVAVVEAKEKKAAAIKPPSIQDRLNAKADEVIAEIESVVDDVFANKKNATKVFDLLTARNVPQAKVGRIRDVFQRQIDEVTAALAADDEQLTEAYAHLTKEDVKRIGAFYVALLADLDSYTHVKKVSKKVRVKRPVSKDKVVSRLKYMKESKELRLVSINPVDILSATEVWVYNVKVRKLYRYQADSHAGTLGIKGASIIGFDEDKSVGKTLRRPEEQLKELMKAGKVALRTFLKDIKAVEVKGTGRLNNDCLILRVS